MECDERRQQLGISRFKVGEFPSKGCFSKNGTAYFGTGGTAEEELREDLPGIQERIWCEGGPDASSSGPIPTAFSMISTAEGGTDSNLPTIVTTELGEGKMFVPCASEIECDERRQQLGISRFKVGDFPSKGCFSKNGVAYFGTGGSAQEELREDLPGIQERIWCDASVSAENTLAISAVTSQSMSKIPLESRNLQTCSYNADIFVIGCNYNTRSPVTITVAAPKARVIDSVMKNTVEEKIETPMQKNMSVWYALEYKYTATFTFPDDQAKIIDISDGSFTSVPPATDTVVKCNQIIICSGRPFVDFNGNNLLAKSISSDMCDGTSSWLGDTSIYVCGDQSMLTQTAHDLTNQHRLGEEWTRNALGEHASVASFAAFSIALMTNQAPSDLVEDSLKAALDEVRHAKMSFRIASLLEGTDVIPGPLPHSNHQFGHDMTALALSVAREGCVDETLSALAAAAEVEMIDKVLDLGAAKGTKYHGIERDLLIRIRNDLRTISIDESNHSALAWRTLDWACMVDVDACDAVQQNVLNEQNLLKSFHRRFGRDFTAPTELSDRMLAAWKSIYSSQKVLLSFNFTASGIHEPGSLESPSSVISLLVENVSRGGIYNRVV